MSENTEEVTETVQEEVSVRKNTRGAFVGKPSASDLFKRRWHSAEGKGFSLKAFARKLAKSGDKMAQDWLSHKNGSLDQKKSDKNISEAQLAAQATKAAKRKVKK